MRVYECENCHSVFILNGADERVINGDYSFCKKHPDCPLCNADMILLNIEHGRQKKE